MTELDGQRPLSALRALHPEACAQVVRSHYQAVYRFLLHLTRNVHWAEDLTQETFAAAWRKEATFRGKAALATWLHRIAYTKFIDAQRADQRNQALLETHARSWLAPPEPADSLEADDDVKRLYQALYRLEAQDCAVLVLHYLQGLSYREVATVLDEPTGTIKWRTSEALVRLRALLGNEVSDNVFRSP